MLEAPGLHFTDLDHEPALGKQNIHTRPGTTCLG